MTGNIEHWALTQVLAMLTAGRQTGLLELVNGPERAEIGLIDGVIVDLTDGPLVGEEALPAIARWSVGTFSFQPSSRPSARTINRATEEILTQITQLAAESTAIRAVVPSLAAIPALSHELPEGPVTLTPAEWQVVSYSDGRNDVGTISAALGRDPLSVSRVIVRLVNSGLVTMDAEAELAEPAPLAFNRPVARERAAQPAPVRAAGDPAGEAFFAKLEVALSDALGPIAGFAIEDELAAANATRSTFPRDAAAGLVERLGGEISEAKVRLAYTQTMLAELRALSERKAAAA
ncbi:MAG: DUF4388 domain-containing protein [Dehalococcoidia bacterium]